jgi:hypothetical protein
VEVKFAQLSFDRCNVGVAFGDEGDVYALEQHGVAEKAQLDRVRERAVGAADVPGDDSS